MGQSPSWPLLLEAGSALVRALRQPVESMGSFLSVRCAPLDASAIRYPAVRRETTADGFETAGRRRRTGTAAPLRASGTTRALSCAPRKAHPMTQRPSASGMKLGIVLQTMESRLEGQPPT